MTRTTDPLAVSVQARLARLLADGWPDFEISRALNERGLRVGRGTVRQLARGQHPHKATLELLAALRDLAGG